MIKNIFFPDIHRRLVKSFAKLLEGEEYNILLPDDSFKQHIKYWEKWSREDLKNEYMKELNNVEVISYDDLKQKNIDIFFITCFEVQDDVLKIFDLYGKKSKLVHYAGNNFVPYNFNAVNNLLTTDETIYYKSKINKKNTLLFFPWVDFINDYKFERISNSKVINSYILNYNKFFPEQFSQAVNLKKVLNNYDINFIENASMLQIPNLINDSFATLHIKPIEGYGFSIIESMAKGRPVILYKPYSHNKIYRHWAIDMETCIYFENEKELLKKIDLYEANYEDIQINCSEKIRSLLKFDKHKNNLINFLKNLV